MKTALQKLIEQLEEKITKTENFAKTQDELGVYLTGGVMAGFMESKLLAEKLLNYEKEKLCYFYIKGAEAEINNPYVTNIEFYNKTFEKLENND